MISQYHWYEISQKKIFNTVMGSNRIAYPRAGAVGAVGHPFGQSRLVDRNALRALLSASAPRMHGPFGTRSKLLRISKESILKCVFIRFFGVI